MSTSDQHPEGSTMQRYRAGLPPRDESERDAYREWRKLDADDLASAIEERLAPDEEFERYEGPLGWTAWLAERRRDQELDRLGIERPELPAPYGQALGPDRALRLGRQVEDRLMNFAFSLPKREELLAQARRFAETARPLNVDLSTRVVELEDRHALLVDELHEATDDEDHLSDTVELLPEGPNRERIRAKAEARRAEAEALRESLKAVTQELTGLSTHEDHPDRWLERNGQSLVEALAAQQQLRGAGAAPEHTAPTDAKGEPREVEGHEGAAAQAAREAPDARLDPF